ncbi:diguanylate cyclase [Thiorhodococcus drewsii AZ1]|uniref:diguanylate cyclase n=1 Tax=Thiorhodococcus drewsii AZ1 TaxID=765913 RepID=G2E418_9GAMM|nr:GGDEF domain-containing protein [Thiorhodococcus drewsii]EGV29911.1 diguanylate cyclase [Thiorhodococcus drewsii AZ1]
MSSDLLHQDGDGSQADEGFSLYAQEEAVIRRAEGMIEQLDVVSNGVKTLADAYRIGYRETVRLVRISDRMQLELHEANRILSAQAEDLKQLNDALHKEIERRERLEHELRRIASIDELTGVHTRRYVLELTEYEQRRLMRHGKGLIVLMMDLDHFKRINDQFGHAAGDQLLRDFGELLRGGLRKGDIAGRFGGEEFLAVLPETELDVAESIANRLCEQTRAFRSPWKDGSLHMTISIGLAEVEGEEPLERAISRADQALYEAKSAGRDRVVTYRPASVR